MCQSIVSQPWSWRAIAASRRAAPVPDPGHVLPGLGRVFAVADAAACVGEAIVADRTRVTQGAAAVVASDLHAQHRDLQLRTQLREPRLRRCLLQRLYFRRKRLLCRTPHHLSRVRLLSEPSIASTSLCGCRPRRLVSIPRIVRGSRPAAPGVFLCCRRFWTSALTTEKPMQAV